MPRTIFYCYTTLGKFIVHIKNYIDYYTKQLDYYMVLIGNDLRKACVNITVPVDSTKPLKVAYVTSEVACTLDNLTPMKGIATVQMIHLGITIARELSPNTKTLVLEDCSHFTCSSPDGPIKMALPSFYIAFHGKTWYEDKFGATLKNSDIRKRYNDGIRNMDNPISKPSIFNFTNMELAETLYPIYNKSNTWNEFFKMIATVYKQNKCTIVQPWIEDAMRHIFGGELFFEMKEWEIILKNIPTISYYELNEPVPKLGGGWDSPPILERFMHRSSKYPFYSMTYTNVVRKTRRLGLLKLRTRRRTH